MRIASFLLTTSLLCSSSGIYAMDPKVERLLSALKENPEFRRHHVLPGISQSSIRLLPPIIPLLALEDIKPKPNPSQMILPAGILQHEAHYSKF